MYQQLLHLLESGNIIREYTQVYESKTQRIPVQYMSRDFYTFFPFSRSNHNKLYLFMVRIFEIAVSLFGLSIGAFLKLLLIECNNICSINPIESEIDSSGDNLIRLFKKEVEKNYKKEKGEINE